MNIVGKNDFLGIPNPNQTLGQAAKKPKLKDPVISENAANPQQGNCPN
jgi:hypothetical protein